MSDDVINEAKEKMEKTQLFLQQELVDYVRVKPTLVGRKYTSRLLWHRSSSEIYLISLRPEPRLIVISPFDPLHWAY